MSEGQAVADDQRKKDTRDLARQKGDVARSIFKLIASQIHYARKYGAEDHEGEEVAAPAPQKEKKSKKRAEPPAAAEENKEKKEKKPKEKTQDWSCKGNPITGQSCSVEPAQQTPSSDTKHNGENYNTCVVCKKEVKKTRRAEKKSTKESAE